MKKTIIITGAAGNLGSYVTTRLLEEEYFVHAALGPKDDVDFITHRNLISNKVNLLDSDSSEEYIHYVTDYQREEPEAIICLVGGFTSGPIENTASDIIQKMIDLNFKTVYHVIKPLVEQCIKKSKPLKIILVGSRPGIEAAEGKNMVAYGLSKSLIFRLAEYINEDTNATGINASIIVPSTMDTPGTRAAMPNADTSNWVPLKEVAETISFVLSETGQMMRKPIYKLYNKS